MPPSVPAAIQIPSVVPICTRSFGSPPANAADTLDTGLDSNASALTVDTEPVRLTFFCTP